MDILSSFSEEYMSTQFFPFNILITFTQQLIQTKVSCLFGFFYYVKLALFFDFTAHCADGGSGDGLSPSDLVNGLNSFAAADPKEKYRLESLPQQVQDTFAAILDNSVLEKRLY